MIASDIFREHALHFDGFLQFIILTLTMQSSTFMGSCLKVTCFILPMYLYHVIIGIINDLFSMMDLSSQNLKL